jgi:site-specific recombinase XerD
MGTALKTEDDDKPAEAWGLWLSAPAEAHRLWREGQQLGDPERPRAYADHSTRQYRSLFGKFCQWMSGNRLNLQRVTGNQVARFLDELKGRDDEPASVRTKRMYLAEIDRVMQHLVDLGIARVRPTELLLDQAKVTTPLKRRHIVLPKVDVDRALESLAAEIEAAGPAKEPAHRRSLMALALAGLMLRGGLTPKELQKLRMKHLRATGRTLVVSAPGHRLLQDRDVKLDGWVANIVERWGAYRMDVLMQSVPLSAKRDATIQSAHLFSHVIPGAQGRKDRALTAKAMYEAVQAICKEAGVKVDIGPQILRNLFIAGLVKQGLADAEIAPLAGLQVSEQVTQVRQQLAPRPPRRPAIR